MKSVLVKNSFKDALTKKELQLGLWCSLCSSTATELLGDSGYDWLLLDTEHTPNELPDIVSQLRSVHGKPTHAIVRPAWNDTVLIKRFLDVGAQTLLIPFVQNAQEAQAAVAATRYPPMGVRGVTSSGRAANYGRIKGYLHEAQSQLCVLLQVETREALAQL
jgi:4-hydroxy-2-oxoheptanedioate aldolase